jgi:hypothetical protein
LFQCLQRLGRILLPGFADEQVHVLWHHHVTDEPEFVPGAHTVEDFHKLVTGTPRSKKRSATVTTEGDEVEIASTVIAPQRVAHNRKTRTLENHKGAPPTPTAYVW